MLCCHPCLVFLSSLFPPGLQIKFYMRPQDCLQDTHLSSLRIFFFRNVVLLYGFKCCLQHGISHSRLVSSSWVLLSPNDINIFILHFVFFFNFEFFLTPCVYLVCPPSCQHWSPHTVSCISLFCFCSLQPTEVSML